MYASGIELPRVNFSNISYSRIPAGSYYMGFDLDNGGKLSKMYSDGSIIVVERDSNYHVLERSLTLDSGDLVDMNHQGFTKPEDGCLVLPPPGEGKCYILSLDGIFASYDSQDKEGYMASPYGEYRSLDFYYHSEGHAMVPFNQRIVSIQMFSDPYTTWTDRLNDIRINESMYLFNGQDSLKMDGSLNTTVFQRLNVNTADSGFSQTAIINSGLYLGTNGKIDKVLSETSGSLTIKLWYAIVDVSDVYTEYAISNPLPAKVNPNADWRDIGYFQIPSLNFLDIPARKPLFSFLDNYPSLRSYTASSYESVRRSHRNKYMQSLNNFMLAYKIGADGFNDGSELAKLSDIPPAPYPDPLAGTQYDIFPYPTGPTASAFGISSITDLRAIRARESIYLHTDGITEICNLPYPPEQGSFIYSGTMDDGQFNLLYYDTSVTRISEVTIDNPGSGYDQGEKITFPDSTGSEAVAIITKVDDTGGILAISFVDRSQGGMSSYNFRIHGGIDYSSPSVNIFSSGVGAILTPIVSTGQWRNIEEVELVSSDGGTTLLSELNALRQQKSNIILKALNEVSIATQPFILSSSSFPEFQLKKYQL